jgi:hypothetical protein
MLHIFLSTTWKEANPCAVFSDSKWTNGVMREKLTTSLRHNHAFGSGVEWGDRDVLLGIFMPRNNLTMFCHVTLTSCADLSISLYIHSSPYISFYLFPSLPSSIYLYHSFYPSFLPPSALYRSKNCEASRQPLLSNGFAKTSMFPRQQCNTTIRENGVFCVIRAEML